MTDLNSRHVIRTLQKGGFVVIRQRDHIRLRHADGRCASVPHYCELHLRTFHLILKQAKVTAEQYQEWERG